MGNLNCFTTDEDRRRSEWFDEWQNNSSYVTPYDYYDRGDYGGVVMDEQDGLQGGLHPYHRESPMPRDPLSRIYPPSDMIYDKESEEESQQVCDNVTEAFMSHWFVREEAELQKNIKELEKNEGKLESDHESVGRKSKSRENSVKNLDAISKHSSDSGMCNLDELAKKSDKNEITMGFSTRKNGYCCYTAYIMCSNTCEWDNFLLKTARIMTGLQRQFHCTIRFSDKISFYRGNSVRTFQIIGNDKGNVIKCKVALPHAMVKLLITPMSGSSEVEEYSKECISNRAAISKRK